MPEAAILPRISIVTASLNQGAFIEKAISSVLDQGYPNLEYFVMDGGSKDNTVAVIEKYARHLTGWVSEPDRGQPDAINKGLARATGEIVAFINCDERYESGTFHAVAEMFAARADCHWVVGAVAYEDEAGQYLREWQPWAPPEDRARWVVRPWGVPSLGSFWSRSVLEQLGLFRADLEYQFDTELGIRLLFAGYRPLIVPRRIGTYTTHAASKAVRLNNLVRGELSVFRAIFWEHLTWRERRRALVRESEYNLRDSIIGGRPWAGKADWARTLALAPLLAARLMGKAVLQSSAARRPAP